MLTVSEFTAWASGAVSVLSVNFGINTAKACVSNVNHVMLQGRKPRSVEDMDKMDVVPDSPSLASEGLPESLQVRLFVIVYC